MTLGRRLAGLTGSWLAAAVAVLAALALAGSLVVTWQAVRMDQREKAALAALQDYGAMLAKLGDMPGQAATDAAFLAAWLSAVQDRPGDAAALERDCRTGRGGAGVRLITAPGVAPAGAVALAGARSEPLPRLGANVHRLELPAGTLCPDRAVEVVAVIDQVAALRVTVGRVVERPGGAWGWAAAAVLAAGGLILAFGLLVSLFARRRLTAAVAEVNRSLDRAALGDFSNRAPPTAVAPELTELSAQVNRTLDRLQELLGWLRDTSDQLAHDFRTPLARATARLDRLIDSADPAERTALAEAAREDLQALAGAMNEAISLRDGETWVFEPVRLDQICAAAAELYQPLADERGVTIALDLAEAEVLGVRSLLQRAVANLVDNAVKFSPDGAEVTVRADVVDGRPGFSVADRGPGIDPALLRPGARPRPAANRESHGMGLPFVRAIVHRHGGRLAVADRQPGALISARF